MALQSSGAISLGDLKTQYSDSGSASMSEFYRGGSRVVSSVTTTETVATPYTYYTTTYSTESESAYGNTSQHYWHTSRNVSWLRWAGTYKNYVYGNTTSVSHSDGWTYSAGAVQVSVPSSWNGVAGTLTMRTIHRSRQVATQNGPFTGYTYSQQTTATQKNTSVPTSGTISLNQFYGGTN
jgi:hypothetical protein